MTVTEAEREPQTQSKRRTWMGEEQPILNLVGEKVALGPHRRDLVPLYTRWMNDFSVTRGLGAPFGPMTREAEEAWFDRMALNQDEPAFLIYEAETLRPIGSTGLHQVNLRHRHAEFGILIGEPECWGRGYGTETTRLMLDFGFHGMGLHNIMLRVYSFNERGLNAYRRAGFHEIGRRREAIWVGGRAWDEVFMDALASEFNSESRIGSFSGQVGEYRV